jgi:hypothetical protein
VYRLAWLLAAACSSAATAPQRPARPAPAAPPPAVIAPSERDCDELITHAVALGIADEASRPGPHSTEADHEAIRRALRDQFAPGCLQLPRDQIRCAIAAPTLASLAACQRTPSSSTSNSSVAPGGISPPPAPRSP